MKNWPNIIVLPLSLLLYFLLWKLLHPLLGYMLDSDCVAYLTLARRVAEGDYFRSINGLWSPLNIWLLVPFIKLGYNAFEAAKWLNGIFGGILIFQFYFLCRQFKLSSWIVSCLMFTVPLVVAFMAYFQLFGDVLQLIFVLLYLSILFQDKFHKSFALPIFSGFIMGIGYYAKAYGLLFYLLHFSIVLWWLFKSKRLEGALAIRQWLIGIAVVILTVLPWSYALHRKYGEWTLTGKAGKLNMSWYINSGKTFKEDIKLLIPPTYDDSPSFWEDPYLSQGKLSSPTSSLSHFARWIARVVHTTLVAVGCFSEISALSIALLLFAWYYFFFKRRKEENVAFWSYQLLVFTITLLPLGYLMMHIETRYIWLNVFLLLLLLGFVLHRFQDYFLSKLAYYGLSVVGLATFVVFPLYQIENLKYKNKELFDIAADLNQHHFGGRFTGNMSDAGRMWVVAYLTHSSFYTIEKTDYTLDELKEEMKRYDVQFYFLQTENNVFETLSLDKQFVPWIRIHGIQVFRFVK